MIQHLDVIVYDKGNHYLVDFLTPAAHAWANKNLNKPTSKWIDGKLVLEGEYADHFQFAMFEADLEFDEVEPEPDCKCTACEEAP